ncbi:MAG: NAD(P)-dependent oxidoreductase [Actinomycetaceae bacterium]|nr:NAD(P)-dependent oxidoreductase [Actinomycetaceae bacterium]MDY6082960.1 NAD(P)-dependent oxidoreductase [Actinomycetaceae bacterium]
MANLQVSIDPFWDFDIGIPGVDVTRWDIKKDGTAPEPGHFDIILTGHWTPANGVDIAKNAGARLLQIGSVGFDMLPENVPEGLQVANASTVHETGTSEMVLTLLLAGVRDIPTIVHNDDHNEWGQFYVDGLADKKVMLIGVGGVGRAIIQRLKPFEVDLTLVASHARDEEFGHVHGMDELNKLLPEQDVVIVIVPANKHTKGLVNKDFLAQMKDGAYFLNAGRGSVAVTEDLAAEGDRLNLLIDTVDPEPLPADSPLWGAAKIITSHNAGNSRAMQPRMKALIERQIRHALAGEPFENIVLG